MIGKVKAATKTKLLDAALRIIREKGYTATTIDDICRMAGVTKGGFFHHFKSKEDLALEAANHFHQMASALFESAPHNELEDPLDRLLGYLDFRISILSSDLPHCTCLLGTMVQEVHDTHPAIRRACDQFITYHANQLARDIELARQRHKPDAEWSAESLGLHMQAVVQGALLLAKARQDHEVAAESFRQLRRYLELLFR
ncbi:MAG: TetR/AcrR family transcriptional regulator [Candidatus Sumerlaeia bacterium]|nr:TetR/AcrR family transcriptional regulator [Candidatus Sumerlaeia bacterium]